jgi:hypothetical protein
MNQKYLLVDSLLKDNFAAAINSYESLPVRTSSDTLISTQPEMDEEKYEMGTEYPFMTVGKIHDKLTRKH